MNTRNHNTFFTHGRVSALLFAVISAVNIAQAASAGSEDHSKHVRAHPTVEIYKFEAADICDTKKNQVRMRVTGLSGGGILTLELYNDPEHFLSKKGRVRRVRVAAQVGEQTVCMTTERLGRYAAAVYHDIDGNRKLKKSMVKVPREPFALSNNPKIKALKFPKFSDSAFELVSGGTNITLELVDLKKQKKLEKAARKLEQAAN